jgi:hypothetical protein
MRYDIEQLIHGYLDDSLNNEEMGSLTMPYDLLRRPCCMIGWVVR